MNPIHQKGPEHFYKNQFYEKGHSGLTNGFEVQKIRDEFPRKFEVLKMEITIAGRFTS